ncbi:hypothetical protein LCGC14_0455880 [marine sediment metagenome]|uniref:Uncharacterized protein n=1 Tax=marine sediment metagenome TaxID=412755 RepID=A0A0F9SZM2_9ZZZZ
MRRVNLATREELVARIRLGERIGGFYWVQEGTGALHARLVDGSRVHVHADAHLILLGRLAPGDVCDVCLEIVTRAARKEGRVEA